MRLILLLAITLSTPLYADRSTDFMDKQRRMTGGYLGTSKCGGEGRGGDLYSYKRVSKAGLERRVDILERRLEELRPIIRELRSR